LKLEYVNQNYNEFTSLYGEDAGFKGLVLKQPYLSNACVIGDTNEGCSKIL
jgi:hypothetical protein